jgi:hypothetical protein
MEASSEVLYIEKIVVDASLFFYECALEGNDELPYERRVAR